MNNFIAHILVVDDDNGIRSLVKQYLNENNFLVTTSNSAENAEAKISVIKFDLIVLDVMMAGKSGLDFIKENKSEIDTPIILLTAKGEAEDRVGGLEMGADDYLPKPFEPKELTLRIKNILDKTKRNDMKRIIIFNNIKIDLNKLLIVKNDSVFKINTPIILLTAKGETQDRVGGLEVGADDYLPKPFEPKELTLRIQNILNKTKKNDQKRIIEFDNIKIDLNKLLVVKNENEYKINNTEKVILEKMINNPGKTFSREDIGKLIDLDKERSIDVIITRLRKKIEVDPKNPKYLQTLRSVGYVLWIE